MENRSAAAMNRPRAAARTRDQPLGQTQPGSDPSSSKAVVFVVGVSLMNAVAMMIVIPVLPRLVESFTGSTASAAHYVGLFATVFALAQFVFAPILGSLSDRYGRRAVILG